MTPQTGSGVHPRRIEEVFRPGDPGYWAHPEWEGRFPWLAQGTTGRTAVGDAAPWDFALFSDPPAPGASEAWHTLGHRLGFSRVVRSRQVHGSDVLIHQGEVRHDLPADGHLTDKEGLLLGVTVADCVPVFLVDPVEQAIGLLHAGWRGVVAGILERGIGLMAAEWKTAPGNLHVHLGPSICGECYEVGREVHRALGLDDPGRPAPVDLRNRLALRAATSGVPAGHVTESTWCTLCDESPFFSHRRGEAGRQVGFMGLLPTGP